jgi:alpha-D-xyloside xylohydrolase
MSGVPFYAHDIGGWYGALKDPELFVRWTQAGVMCSHTRFHGGGPREPWIFGPEVEAIISQWIKWRYRLIPYLRACEREAAQNGMPVMRSMALAFPGERAAWSFEEQYMLGPSLLVAPIIQPGGSVEVYLPKGGWYDIFKGQRYEGGQVISLENMPLDQMPIFGREGSWLPLGPVVQHTDELTAGDTIEELWVFGDPDPANTLGIEQVKLEESQGTFQFNLPEGVSQKHYR